MKKFKDYEVIEAYPEDGWLKGYFNVWDSDTKGGTKKSAGAYRDIGYLAHKDYALHLLDIKKGERVLDIGCADGIMMVYCGLLGAEVYGIDISPEYIIKANAYLARYGIKGEAVISDAKHLNFPDNYFDKVVSSDFFEHMSAEDNVLVLKELKRVLKPGGFIIVKTPNLKYLRFSRFYKMFARMFRLKNPFNIVIAHTTGPGHQHIGLATEGMMIQAIKKAGFLNFEFYYDTNSKIARLNYSSARFFAENYFLRSIFTEDLIVKIYKPVILSFFP